MPKSNRGELSRAGEFDLVQDLAGEPKPITLAMEKLLDAGVLISQEPDAVERAYLARELVQCTLPHSNPGDIPIWTRTNGNLTLVVARTGFDPKTLQPIGYPYGSIPRLLLFWLNTEAVRTGKRRLELGDTFSGFIRELGLNPRSGGGPGGDHRRVREQMRRLFSSAITFQYNGKVGGLEVEKSRAMNVRDEDELWWDPKRPDQVALWGSWVELGEKFFQAITESPVPSDLRALRALKQSPLALDLYIWATHKAFSAARKGKAQFIPWQSLARQFGADYKQPRDFKMKAIAALKKIQTVYPGLHLQDATDGLIVLSSSKPAVPSAPTLPALRG
jgi:hypothetical protein